MQDKPSGSWSDTSQNMSRCHFNISASSEGTMDVDNECLNYFFETLTAAIKKPVVAHTDDSCVWTEQMELQWRTENSALCIYIFNVQISLQQTSVARQ